MNQNPHDPSEIEPLIRDYLRDQARNVDAGRILDGVRARRRAGSERGRDRSPASRLGRLARRSAIGSAAAVLAVVVLGFAWNFRQASAHAEVVRLVRDARDQLAATPSDRSYRIEIRLAPGSAERSPYLAALAGFDCRLWTRSDRFWVEGRRGSRAWASGRDERRHVWVAPDPEVGIDFRPEEIPGPLDEAFDLFHFDLDSLLEVLASDFDVTELPGPSEPSLAGLTRIQGTPRTDHPRPRLRSITALIDERTKVVRQVVLARVRDGRTVGDVSFTFDRAGTQPDSAYRLEAHLGPDAPILDHDQRLRRRRALVRFFGSLLLPEE